MKYIIERTRGKPETESYFRPSGWVIAPGDGVRFLCREDADIACLRCAGRFFLSDEPGTLYRVKEIPDRPC